MDRFQHLLTKLAEESSEITKIALKTSQFGGFSIEPNQPFTNIQQCHHELDDLMAIVEMLNEQYCFSYLPNRVRIEAKKVKVKEYLEYSINLGAVK